MSFIQGTVVALNARFTTPDPEDPRRQVPFDPPEVVLRVVRPDGTVNEFTRGGGTVERVEAGHFRYRLDTAPAAGTWEYQFENPHGDSVVKRGQVTVRSRIGLVPPP